MSNQAPTDTHEFNEWRDILVPCESCGMRVGEWCKHVSAAIHQRADTPADSRIVFEHGSTGPCSACGDGDTAQRYHKHGDTPTAVEAEGKPSDKTIGSQFHKVWTSQVGTEGYNKKDWQELRRLLDLRGIRV